MKKENISDALNNIDFDMVEDVYECTKTNMKKPKSIWLKWGAIAACFAVAFIAVAGIAFRGFFNKPVYLGNGKIDISSLSGAQIMQSPPDVSQGINGDIYPAEEFVSILKERTDLIVYGTIQNLKTVKVDELGAYSWYVSTFEIHVIDEIRNGDGTQIITVVSAARYYDDMPEYICGLSSNFDLAESKAGLFVMRENTDETWRIAGANLIVAELGDYRASSQFECNGESFNYFGELIDLDELKKE